MRKCSVLELCEDVNYDVSRGIGVTIVADCKTAGEILKIIMAVCEAMPAIVDYDNIDYDGEFHIGLIPSMNNSPAEIFCSKAWYKKDNGDTIALTDENDIVYVVNKDKISPEVLKKTLGVKTYYTIENTCNCSCCECNC